MIELETIYVDMDGVLCDFVVASITAHGGDPEEFKSLRPAPWKIADWLGITNGEFWKVVDSAGEDFWANLPRYQWFDDLMQIVKFHAADVHFLTSPSLLPECRSGKQKWLNREFGCPVINVTYTTDKWRLAKPGCVLIDDSDRNCQQFADAGGNAILFPQPWNSHFDIERPTDYVYEQLSLMGDDGCDS